MSSATLVAIARRLMRKPAAPFYETAVRSEVEAVCDENRLEHRRDRSGNLLIEHRKGRIRRPLVLVAHLDHPGFQILERIGLTLWRARFLGGVPPEYFRRGTRLQLMPQMIPAKLGAPIGKPEHREYELHTGKPVTGDPDFAVWDLEVFGKRNGKIHGRACDDLIGVTAILTTLIAAKQSNSPCHLIGAITRAEEVGFGGALALVASRALPVDSLVISVETSREMPPVKMGRGAIIRVGDRSSVFDSRASRFLSETAGDLSKAVPGFRCQRALMQGGSCEGTVFADASYQTAAACVALGNYHNCGPRNRVAAEFVSLGDVVNLVKLLTSAGLRMREFDQLANRLRRRLAELNRKHRSRLMKTARPAK